MEDGCYGYVVTHFCWETFLFSVLQWTFSAENVQSRETSRSRVTSSVSTTEMLSTYDVSLENVDGSLFHIKI